MGRKEKNITIESEGRDKGKSFRIKELGALKIEKWTMRAINALISSGVDVPGLEAGQGIEGLTALKSKEGADRILKALLTGLDIQKFEPLLDEMFQCIEYIDPKGGTRTRLELENIDLFIEEAKTLLILRMEVLSLHMGFDLAGFLSNFRESQEKERESSE